MGPTLHSFSQPVALVVSALAVYRLTRLVVSDEVVAGPRERVTQRGGKAAYFITCPWCVSVWFAIVWAVLLWLIPYGALVVGAVLAWSAVAGLLSSWE